MTYPIHVLAAWIEALQEKGVGLTEWEQNFINSVESQLQIYSKLSDKQVEILERIYAEKTK